MLKIWVTLMCINIRKFHYSDSRCEHFITPLRKKTLQCYHESQHAFKIGVRTYKHQQILDSTDNRPQQL